MFNAAANAPAQPTYAIGADKPPDAPTDANAKPHAAPASRDAKKLPPFTFSSFSLFNSFIVFNYLNDSYAIKQTPAVVDPHATAKAG